MIQHVLTCCKCTNQRASQAYETYVQPGGRTEAFCPQCKEMTHHWIGTPTNKTFDMELSRKRKPRS